MVLHWRRYCCAPARAGRPLRVLAPTLPSCQSLAGLELGLTFASVHVSTGYNGYPKYPAKFIQSLDLSIFPHKKAHVNVEGNENDEDSSFSDPELCPIENIENDEFASPQEFFPLASQCLPSFAISNRPPVQYGKGQPLSSHWNGTVSYDLIGKICPCTYIRWECMSVLIRS